MIVAQGKTKRVENYLRAAHFGNPEWIPCRVSIMPGTWKKYREEVEEIVLRHPKIFPGYKKGERNFDEMPTTYREGEHTDAWGCVWKNIAEGLDGAVVRSPLENWDAMDEYSPPDPLTQGDWGKQVDWEKVKENFKRVKAEGGLARGGLTHGFMYMRLYYLRGFENFMIDVATDDPRLKRLIEMVLDYNMKIINKYLEAGAEYMSFGDDLGLQNSLPISPEKFRKYLKPCYTRMFTRCREKGVGVYFHSDGHILEIIGDLIESGVTILNPQIRANTLEGLERVAKGRVCIDLDLDRQLFPFATPDEIREHIREAVGRLSSEKGGLMLMAECEPDVPLENIEVICETLEEVGGPSI